MAKEWFIKNGDRIQGPFTDDETQDMVRTGRLDPDMMVRNSPSNKWIKAGSAPGLFNNPAEIEIEFKTISESRAPAKPTQKEHIENGSTNQSGGPSTPLPPAKEAPYGKRKLASLTFTDEHTKDALPVLRNEAHRLRDSGMFNVEVGRSICIITVFVSLLTWPGAISKTLQVEFTTVGGLTIACLMFSFGLMRHGKMQVVFGESLDAMRNLTIETHRNRLAADDIVQLLVEQGKGGNK